MVCPPLPLQAAEAKAEALKCWRCPQQPARPPPLSLTHAASTSPSCLQAAKAKAVRGEMRERAGAAGEEVKQRAGEAGEVGRGHCNRDATKQGVSTRQAAGDGWGSSSAGCPVLGSCHSALRRTPTATHPHLDRPARTTRAHGTSPCRPWLRRRVRPRSAPPRRAPRWSTARQRLPTRPSAAWQRWQSRVGRVCREGRGGGREGDKGTISGHVRATFAGLRSFAQRPFNASCPHLRFSATPRTRLTCHVTNSSASFPPLSPSQARHRGGPRPRRRAGRRGAGARCRGGRERPRRGQRGD